MSLKKFNFLLGARNLIRASGSLSLLSNRVDFLVTNRVRVNTLINETNVKYEVTTLYQFEILLLI